MKYLTKNSTSKKELSAEDQEILSNMHIDHATSSLKLFSFEVLTSSYKGHGFGIEAANSGIEFVDTRTWRTVRIGSPSLTEIRQSKDEGYKTCCMFFSFIDYLCFLSLRSMNPITFALPESPSFLIMSSVASYYRAVAISDLYDRIYLFLPRNEFGGVMSKTIQMRNPSHVVNYDVFYAGYVTLFDFYRHKMEEG